MWRQEDWDKWSLLPVSFSPSSMRDSVSKKKISWELIEEEASC